MAHGDFKDLPRRTYYHKVILMLYCNKVILCDKAILMLKMLKMLEMLNI